MWHTAAHSYPSHNKHNMLFLIININKIPMKTSVKNGLHLYAE